jgi:hypothetical protein
VVTYFPYGGGGTATIRKRRCPLAKPPKPGVRIRERKLPHKGKEISTATIRE